MKAEPATRPESETGRWSPKPSSTDGIKGLGVATLPSNPAPIQEQVPQCTAASVSPLSTCTCSLPTLPAFPKETPLQPGSALHFPSSLAPFLRKAGFLMSNSYKNRPEGTFSNKFLQDDLADKQPILQVNSGILLLWPL